MGSPYSRPNAAALVEARPEVSEDSFIQKRRPTPPNRTTSSQARANERTETFLRHDRDEYCAFVQRVLAVNAPGHIGDDDPASRR